MKNKKQFHRIDPKIYESFDMGEHRYYGVFVKYSETNVRISVDPKRYTKFFTLEEDQLKIINQRKTPLFVPKKQSVYDYNVNCMLADLQRISNAWERKNKPMIKKVLSEISGKTFHSYEDDNALQGIVDWDEAATNAQIMTQLSHATAEIERENLLQSLQGQFFHQMVSQIEALFVKMLHKNGYEGDKFDRNVLYAFKGQKKGLVSTLNGFNEYSKMYAIWNFLKHNNESTYTTLKTHYPETLVEQKYNPGDIGCHFVKFEEGLIESILQKVADFIIDYCKLAFDEDVREASWNSHDSFYLTVRAEIEEMDAPLGFRFSFY